MSKSFFLGGHVGVVDKPEITLFMYMFKRFYNVNSLPTISKITMKVNFSDSFVLFYIYRGTAFNYS